MFEVEVRVARGAASLYLASIVSLALNTVYFIVLTNALPAETVGLVSLLNVIVIGIATASALALPVVGSGVTATPPAVTRFLPEFIREGRGRAGRVVFAVSAGIGAAISVSLALILASPSVAVAVSRPLSPTPVLYAALDAVFYSLGQVGAYSLIGAGRATRAGSVIAASAVLKYLAASALLLLGGGASGVFIGFSVGDFALLAVTLLLASRGIPRSGEPGFDRRVVAAYMVSILASGLIGFGVSQTDRLLAFVQRGFADLAVYNAASVGSAIAAFAPTALTNVLVPILGSLRGEEASRKGEIMRNYTRYVSLVAFPMGFGLAAISPSLLSLFGPGYVSGSALVAVMAISISLTAVSSVYSSGLLAAGRIYQFLASNVLALGALIAVSSLLVPAVGLLGVAVGRAVMFFVGLLALALFVRFMGDLVFDARGYLKPLAGSTAMAVVVYGLLTLLTDRYVHTRLGSVVVGAAMVPVGAGVYVAAMRLLHAFTERDIEFIGSLLPRPFPRLLALMRKVLL